MMVKIPKHNALVPFAERRKINMKKKELGKKVSNNVSGCRLFAVLISDLEFNGITSYSRKNNVLIEQFEQYEEAVK